MVSIGHQWFPGPHPGTEKILGRLYVELVHRTEALVSKNATCLTEVSISSLSELPLDPGVLKRGTAQTRHCTHRMPEQLATAQRRGSEPAWHGALNQTWHSQPRAMISEET